MKLTILSHIRHYDGLIDVDVVVDSIKVYTFTLASEYDYEKVEALCRRKKPGSALNYLKRFNQRRRVCQEYS